MKNRTFILAAIAVLLVFGGLFLFVGRKNAASSPEEKAAASLARPFDAKATIKMDTLELTADVNRTAPGQMTVTVTKPPTLAGMAFSYDGSDIAAGYKGITVQLNGDSKLASSLIAVLVNSIDKAAGPGGAHVAVKDGALTVSGRSESGDFNILLDQKNGSILELNLPELDFECRFDDFIFGK